MCECLDVCPSCYDLTCDTCWETCPECGVAVCLDCMDATDICPLCVEMEEAEDPGH